jgi:hypothetical protein
MRETIGHIMLPRPLYLLYVLAPVLSKLADRLRLRAPAPIAIPLLAPPPKPDALVLAEEQLKIPVVDQCEDDTACLGHHERGQFLARQDRWSDLVREIRTADAARLKTPGGMPVAELLAFGARSDVVLAAEHALQDAQGRKGTTIVDGIMALETVRKDMRDDPIVSTIVAMAHIDIAWAWRGTGRGTLIPKLNRTRCAAHFDRARELLRPFWDKDTTDPFVANACCSLLAGQSDPSMKIADFYENLINLDPENYRHMRALGNHMLPRWFGSFPELELEARRTASRTQKLWGAGGYTWVYFDAIVLDDEACAQVDVPFFVDGLRDILAARPCQMMVNLLASYCAVALRNGMGLNEQADMARIQIAECADWIIRDHLTELHPLVWAHAADGFDNNARVTSTTRFAARGRSDALRVIADLFRDELADGLHITFTPSGPELHGS